jgi:hypothetical protein
VRQGYGSQLLVSLEWFSCSGPDTIRWEAAQANRWLRCQPSSYVRLEAYGSATLHQPVSHPVHGLRIECHASVATRDRAPHHLSGYKWNKL